MSWAPTVCSRCELEIRMMPDRFGRSWQHQHPADHLPVLGTPIPPSRPDGPVAEAPEPELAALPVGPPAGDPAEVLNSTGMSMLLTVQEIGWRWRVDYSLDRTSARLTAAPADRSAGMWAWWRNGRYEKGFAWPGDHQGARDIQQFLGGFRK